MSDDLLTVDARREIQPPPEAEEEVEEADVLVDEAAAVDAELVEPEPPVPLADEEDDDPLAVDPLPELAVDAKPVDVEPTSSLH